MGTPQLTDDKEVRHQKFRVSGLKHYDYRVTDFLHMEQARELIHLHAVSEELRGRIRPPFCTAIGSITSGTKRTPGQNLNIFDAAYDAVRSGRYPGPKSVFYQLPFEFDIWRIANDYYGGHHNGDEFYVDLFRDFYGPIMEDERLEAVILLPDYELSKGAMIEYGILKSRKNPPVFYNALDHFPELESLLK